MWTDPYLDCDGDGCGVATAPFPRGAAPAKPITGWQRVPGADLHYCPACAKQQDDQTLVAVRVDDL